MCETRDLGIKWPHWRTLILEGEVRIFISYICPRDVKKMLVLQARLVYRKKWAAKHEHEEFEGGDLVGAHSCLAAQEDERRVD